MQQGTAAATALLLHGWRQGEECPTMSSDSRKPKKDLDPAQMLTYLFMYMDPIMIPFLELSGVPINPINGIP